MLKTRAETNEDHYVGAPQKALSTELVTGLNVNGAKQMHIFTSYRSDSSMPRSCMKPMVSIVLALFQLFAQVQEPQV
jgi:hypothetical protein